MMNELSLIDIYRKNEISSVRQEIPDLSQHFERRASLHRQLGILPAFLRGRTVLEAGPGSVQNSLYTASLKPEQFVLLEPSPQEVKYILNLFDHMIMELIADIVLDWLSYLSQKNISPILLPRPIRMGFLGGLQ